MPQSVGTVNVFEAAREHWGQVQGLSYASSLAVLGPDEYYAEKPVMDSARLFPETLYGVLRTRIEKAACVS